MKTMKAVVLKEVKGIGGFAFTKVPRPKPGTGEVLVKIRAAALNHRDLWIAQGLYAKIITPVILGSDGAGVIAEVGEGVSRDWLNREVIINPSLNWGSDPAVQQKDYRILGMPDNGTQAEYLVVPVTNVYEKPAYLGWEEAAAIPLGGLTGYRALFTRGNLKAGETVLLTGIGGGVASLMLKMALIAGATVVVTSGDSQKIEAAQATGALGGANYKNTKWTEEIRRISANRPIDLVVDSAGGEGFARLTGLVKPGGRIVFFGATAGNPSQVNLRQIFWKQITLVGTTMGNEKDFREMVRLFETHRIQPLLDNVYSFEQYASAYRRMSEGKQCGKIVLKW